MKIRHENHFLIFFSIVFALAGDSTITKLDFDIIIFTIINNSLYINIVIIKLNF